MDVCTTDCQFQSVGSAVAYATSLGHDATINVAAGDYTDSPDVQITTNVILR